MEIENNTAYEIESMPLMGPGEKPFLVVVVKATFELHEKDGVVCAEEQLPIFYGDEFYDPETGGSIKFESDLAPFKPKTDIALIGRAYSPGNVPVKRLSIALKVGNYQYKLSIFGDRKWRCLGRFLPAFKSKPQPFTAMDILYDRAFGGIDTVGGGYCSENLVGCGFVAKKKRKALNGVSLPNIENPDSLIRSWKDRPKPSGFGFLSKSWTPRLEDMGTYDENWQKNRAPKPPSDFRFDHYNAAHPNLRITGYLKGGESVELVNLTPNGYRKFKLPEISLRCTAFKSYTSYDTSPAVDEQQPQETIEPELLPDPVTMNLDTLCMLPDENQFYMVWRGLCRISDLTAIEIKKIAVDEKIAVADRTPFGATVKR